MTISDALIVELAAGGDLILQTPSEVDRWTTLSSRYQEDYELSKTNDLALLDVILQQHMVVYRAQQAVNGLVPELDEDHLPTGNIKRVTQKPAELARQQEILLSASKEIRALEAALGIDKKSRDQGGQHSLMTYIETLRDAGHEYSVHVTERTLAFEYFVNELSWRVRLNLNGDDEDKTYHDCHDSGILGWCRREIETLEQISKDFAHQKGQAWAGKL